MIVRYFEDKDIPFIKENISYFNFKISDTLFENRFSRFLVCEENQRQVGFLQYSKYYDRIEIDYIFVCSNYRRCGFAKAMIKFLLKYCETRKCENITLEVSEKNESAIKLYRKFGFESVATRENYYGHGENAILMIRRF